MKIISHELGKVLRLFVADEIHPAQGINLPDLINGIAQRYNFLPPDLSSDNKGGREFKYGKININGDLINISSLTIYSEAVAVNIGDTSKSLIVINDLFDWLQSEFKFRKPVTQPKDFYESHLVVEFDSDLDNFIKPFAKISKLLSTLINETYDISVKVDFSGFAISADSTLLPSYLTPIFNNNFTINRRIGIAFSQNRYYCTAPFPTDKHIKLLENVENFIKN
ncbi:MAG: hypothetical protein WCJ33_00420 [Pseudomonadota bacterium]